MIQPNELRAQRQDLALITFLRANLQSIRVSDDAPDISRAVFRLRQRVERVIDNADPGVYVGPCWAVVPKSVLRDGTVYVETGECGAELMARLGEEAVTCEACGTEYDVAVRRQHLLDEVRDTWAPIPEVANGLTGLHLPVTQSMIRQMVFRSEVLYLSDSDKRVKVGDVMDVLARRAERKAARMAGKTSGRKAS